MTNRLGWIDSLRGFAMLCGVAVHFFLMIEQSWAHESFRCLCGFVLPLFMAISGYLFKAPRDMAQWRRGMRRGLVRYIVPYFIFGVLSLLIYIITEACRGSLSLGELALRCIGLLWARGSWVWIPYCSPVFYFTALYLGLGIFGLILLIKKPALRLLCLLCCVGISYALDLMNFVKLPWNLDSALMMQIFLLLGYEIRRRSGHMPRRPLLWSLALAALGSCFIITNRFFGADEMSFNNNSYGSLIHMAAGGTAMVLALFIAFRRLHGRCGRRLRRLLEFYGRGSMAVTAFDPMVRDLIIKLFALLGIEFLWPLRYVLQLAVLALPALLWTSVWDKYRGRLFRLLRAEEPEAQKL